MTTSHIGNRLDRYTVATIDPSWNYRDDPREYVPFVQDEVKPDNVPADYRSVLELVKR